MTLDRERFAGFRNDMYEHANVNSYGEAAKSTAVYPDAGKGTKASLAYVALGLTNEAGEVAGKIKKLLRGDDDSIVLTRERRSDIIAELGDVGWYFAMLCYELDVSPNEVLLGNLEKLAARQEAGTLKGDGDNR